MSHLVGARLRCAARTWLVAAFVGSVALAGPAVADPAPGPPGVYGDPVAAAQYWQPQTLEDSCGLMAVADLVGQETGKLPTEVEMVDLAIATPSRTQEGPIYKRPDPNNPATAEGISLNDLPVLLEHFGVPSEVTYTGDAGGIETGLPALEQYLGQGRGVIAFVNSAIIWADSANQHESSDHFVVVTGIDANRGVAHINDSGAEEGGANDEIKLDTFLAAWNTGEDSMVVTAAA